MIFQEKNIQQMPETEETIAEFQKIKTEKFMYGHFIDALTTGEFKPLSNEQIKELIEENYFSFKPLFQLEKIFFIFFKTSVK